MPTLLTALAVEKARARPMRREIADARLTGLYLIIQRSGAKSWALRFRYSGKPRKLTLGSYPQVDVAKARQRASAALEVVSQGRDPCAEKRVAKARRQEPHLDRDSFGAVARIARQSG